MNINQANGMNGQLAIDTKGMSELRSAARQNSPEALRQTAQQFESLFMNMVMKSMREATPQDGVFDSEQSRMYTSMLDQQMSQNLAKKGVGLADMLVRQLSNSIVQPPPDGAQQMDMEQMGMGQMDGMPLDIAQKVAERVAAQSEGKRMAKAGADNGAGKSGNAAINAGTAPGAAAGLASAAKTASASPAVDAGGLPKVQRAASRPAHVREFQDRLANHAEEASRATGIPAKFMLGQAALESGWGRREIVAADGSKSHNLFGIKATAGWKGKTVEAVTTEYVNGVAQRKVEKFRAYDSYADAFRDYAKLLTKNPRYERVVANAQDAASFAHGLQKAGYATDPHYASKLSRLIRSSFSA